MALFRSFDVLFSVSECLAGIILVCDLHCWDYRCVNVITWVLWFLWVLCLDALTPPARHYLRFKKFAATPIQLFLLYAYLGVPLVLYVFVDPKLTSRLVYSVNSVEIRTDTLAVARMLTLALWQTRLLWDLGVRDDSEFIFLRDLVEYTVPRDVASSSDDGLRASSANAIVPRAVVQPKD
ncbi:hypothetical protein Poli38472_003005 [Pythium oligandrum]|uniref:Uncharacterized protein n=1 Tax=Pythium oligandrum TaxID=41045 RepID=A0A8K1C672_PYTOL|nr:hypothetical protein Poli38472_003005 [Pythium oligandrum]|eukprot:TMW57080.1 hypothetical protein Poli38472_003005 [Pythium oligandrum]